MFSEEKLNMMIEQKQSRIDQGIITNNKSLSYAKRDIKRWKSMLDLLKNK